MHALSASDAPRQEGNEKSLCRFEEDGPALIASLRIRNASQPDVLRLAVQDTGDGNVPKELKTSSQTQRLI